MGNSDPSGQVGSGDRLTMICKIPTDEKILGQFSVFKDNMVVCIIIYVDAICFNSLRLSDAHMHQ